MNRRSFIGKAAALPAALTLAHAASPSGPVFYVETKRYNVFDYDSYEYTKVIHEASRAYCFNSDMTLIGWRIYGANAGEAESILRGMIRAKYPDAVFKSREDEPEEYSGLNWRSVEKVECWFCK